MKPSPHPAAAIVAFAAAAFALGIHHQADARNLLANPSAQSGATDGWTIIAGGGNGWGTRGTSYDGDGSSFVSSYAWCQRSQTIDLLAEGYTADFLDRSPPIRASEAIRGMTPSNAADQYYLRVELRDENGIALATWERGTQASPLVAFDGWTLEENVFENYPAGVRQIYWEDGGKDVEFWLGFYGTIFDAALLEFDDPEPTGIHLTPGSYPVGATVGGVAGILTTDDNPGSTHTYDLVADTSEQLIVQRGANWRYTDTDVDLSALDWKAPSGTEAGQFDDSGWLQGFAELGYGENDEATPINGEGNVIAHYFRHEFSIGAGGLDNLTGLTLRLKRDDGAVVYLNGQEIARDNMPAGPIDAFTLAAGNASDDGANFHEFTVPLALLQEGVNTLAAEVHQAALTSSDVSFDLELAAQQIAEDYDNALFAIDGDRVIFAQDASSIPVTVGATWTIQVRTTDDAGNQLSERLTITGVEDPTEPPTDITLDPATLVEDELPGTLVGVFTTADADVGDLHSYTFAAGEGDADNGSFTISADRLLTAEIFDAGVQSSYSIRVRSTDSAGLSVEKALAVTITNKNDPPTDIQLSASQVPGSADADTLIGTLSTDDPDNPLGETHTYAVLPLLGATPIFGFGSEWRFLDTGTSLDAENWTAAPADFDDSGWKTGTGTFGYGDAQSTVVDFGPDANNKFPTTYFRRTFTLANLNGIDAVEIRLIRDDGAAVFLNGVEVARDNLAAGALYATFADTAIGDADETTPVIFTADKSLLAAGENTIAVEVHQVNATSSDLSFDLALFALGDTSAAPYVQIANGNEVQTNAAFAAADLAPGTRLPLSLRSTDSGSEFVDREFTITIISDDPDDIDGDRLPDVWESQFFTDIFAQNAADDSDGDGKSNGDELAAGTNPNDGADFLDLAIEPIPAGGFRLTWQSQLDHQYRLYFNPDLAPGNWGPIGDAQAGTGESMSTDHTPPANTDAGHYRLEASPIAR